MVYYCHILFIISCLLCSLVYSDFPNNKFEWFFAENEFDFALQLYETVSRLQVI